MNQNEVLMMRQIVKRFSSVTVLKGVTFEVKKGEIHALCGENGAGKSTMMKILSGFYPYGEYEGEILIDGQVQHFSNTRESSAAGIEIIYQELEVAGNMTVAENIYMGREPVRHGMIDKEKMVHGASDILRRLKVDLDPNSKVEKLGVGMKQMVVIAKSLLKQPKVLILDEPSAALSEAETENLLAILRDLKASGVACVYISHRLDEVMEIADRITVIRDGETIVTDDRQNMDKEKLIRYMVGRKLSDQFAQKVNKPGDVILSVKNLNAVEPRTGKKILRDVSFEVRRGEILGFAGLIGAGRTEIAMAIMGVLEAKTTGEILLDGKELDNKTPRAVIDQGINIVTEDRRVLGLIPDEDIRDNIILASLDKVSRAGVISDSLAIRYANDYVDRLQIKTASIYQQAGRLSGGNQQKVVIAKALMTQPKVLILDEPTRGIDVGAKSEIYQIMEELACQGVAIMMISSELPEVLGMADRVIVMNEGRVTGQMDNSGLTQEAIMRYATEVDT